MTSRRNFLTAAAGLAAAPLVAVLPATALAAAPAAVFPLAAAPTSTMLVGYGAQAFYDLVAVQPAVDIQRLHHMVLDKAAFAEIRKLFSRPGWYETLDTAAWLQREGLIHMVPYLQQNRPTWQEIIV
jgi:hypothetical protein